MKIDGISDAKSADADAVLLLENTKFQHYVNGDRHVGFNADETLAVLKVFFCIQCCVI